MPALSESALLHGVGLFTSPLDVAAAQTVNPVNNIFCVVNDPDPFRVPQYRNNWREVRGFYKNSAGVGIPRLINVVDAATGTFLGTTVSAADGSFTVQIANRLTRSVLVIGEPNAADGKNAIVLDAILPVAPL